ncbi:PLC-like phosphodiesterase [Lasiosphaeria hispida]|uniref:Phosphoinositide phospholipase C n=1 Tax=Lasiosphaeria hispida TaxID=260671 RepID=A0AAJ0MFN7_9PEZI|nr:PLC-like phosphodiesterase [Lasiosphaeria hispida]
MKAEWAGLLLEKPIPSCDPDERQPLLEELSNKILIKVKLADDSPERRAQRSRALQHFYGLNSLTLRSPSHVFSLEEAVFAILIQDRFRNNTQSIKEHNRNFFMRIYPRGTRIECSNPTPGIFWQHGVQMVSMNCQKTDEGMMLNDAMFADTNGWVLKPSVLPGDNEARKTPHLSITILAGHSLPLPQTDSRSRFITADKKFRPYVQATLYLAKTEEETVLADSCETPSGEGDDSPDWGRDAEPLEFTDLPGMVEELSFLR